MEKDIKKEKEAKKESIVINKMNNYLLGFNLINNDLT